MNSQGAGGSRDDDKNVGSSTSNGSSIKKLSEFVAECQNDLADGNMFAIYPLNDCPHLDMINDVPVQGINIKDPCQECSNTSENWICLICFTVHCARNINQHASIHAEDKAHPLTLSFTDLSVWCYGCDAYIDNPKLYNAKNSAYKNKFNSELPWTYGEQLISLENNS